MEEVVLVSKQIIIRFTTVVHNLATFPGQITLRNTQIEIYWRKRPKIYQSIFDSWLLKANLKCPIRFFLHFSKTLKKSFAWYTLLVYDLEFTTPRWSATTSLLHLRLTCAWQYFGTLIFDLFFEIIRFYVDNINFLFLC